MVVPLKTEHYTGSDCTGSSGDSDRTLTLSNTGTTTDDGFLVYTSGLALALTSEYTVVHASSSTVITFLKPVWDDQTIAVNYNQQITGAGVTADSDDFSKGPLSDFGVEVTRTAITMTTDHSGDKIYKEGSDTAINVVFEPYKESHNLDKAGLTKVYDARMFLKPDATLNKYDKITYDSKVYRVEEVSIRRFSSTLMFYVAGLFYITNE